LTLVNGAIYQGNIGDGVWLIDHIHPDLWVVERNRGGPFNEQSRLPEDAYKSVAATAGVAQASPFITYAVQREVGGSSQQFTIIGYEVFGGLGGPGRIIAGRTIQRSASSARCWSWSRSSSSRSSSTCSPSRRSARSPRSS
jgi:putative ABC transport system permease protein